MRSPRSRLRCAPSLAWTIRAAVVWGVLATLPSFAAAQAAEPAATKGKDAEAESLEVVRVVFRGNRKVEDDAIRVNLRTLPGVALTQDMLRDDVRAIWRMGFFEDVTVEVTPSGRGQLVAFVLKEKPSIRKIYVSGYEEVGLSKVNEVLDIKKEQILDLAKIKKNVEKIKDLYIQRGFYLSQVTYEVRRETPNEVDVYFKIDENAKVEVRRINFVGNHAASDGDLRSVMATQEGDLFSFVTSTGTYREDVFERDVLLVQAYYHDHGYIDVKVSEPKLELSPDKRSLFITIPIEEGPQFRVGTLDVQGDLLESREFYISKIKTQPGDVFNKSQVFQDIQALVELYKDKGYAYANATPQPNKDDKRLIIDLAFDIQKGSEVYFDRIEVRGNTKTRDKVIRREMRITEGEKFTQAGLDLSKRRVTALGFFERVDVSTKRGESDDKMDVNIEVAERQTGAFQIGAGFSSVESFIAQAQISQNNLFGRGQDFTLQAQFSGLRQLFMFNFQDYYFLDTNWTFGLSLFNQQIYYYSFFRTSRGGSLTWGYLLTDYLRLFLTYTLQNVGISPTGGNRLFSSGLRTPFPTGSLANLLRSGWSSSWRVSLSYDTRDNRLFTKRGWYNTASAEFAEPLFLSENVYTRYDAAARYYYPIWGPFVLRLKLEGGLVSSRDRQGVPISERYFVGGIFDIRGYSPRSLGPRIRAPEQQNPDLALSSFPIGGNAELIANAEIEFPILEKVGIRGVVFADAGNAYNTENQYCRLRPAGIDSSLDPCNVIFPLSSVRASWGWGLRWFSPIGPLRFEWGVPFRTLPGEQPLVFEFTIGNFF